MRSAAECVCVWGQASMTPEERAAAIAKMPVADRAAALVCVHGSCESWYGWWVGCWGGFEKVLVCGRLRCRMGIVRGYW